MEGSSLKKKRAEEEARYAAECRKLELERKNWKPNPHRAYELWAAKVGNGLVKSKYPDMKENVVESFTTRMWRELERADKDVWLREAKKLKEEWVVQCNQS